MAITRLSGGTTPPNGSDPRTFPAIWNDAVDDIEAAEADITTLQNSLNNLEVDDLADVTITNVADGEILAYNTGNWVNQAAPENTGFTASTTITATDSSFPVPALGSPIVKVTVIGGGGGGGGGGVVNGGAGGQSKFDTSGAGTVVAAGGGGGSAAPNVLGRTPAGRFASANFGGGVASHSGIHDSSQSGAGGQITVAYLDLTGISAVDVTIGAGGTGGSGNGGGASGLGGQVILEFVAG